MGTRADFYVGRGENAIWLGSIGFDGYPEGVLAGAMDATTKQMAKSPLVHAQTEREFALLVSQMLRDKKSFYPDRGWPWPWETSETTDYTYAFDDGELWVSHYGSPWYQPQRGRRPKGGKQLDVLDEAERRLAAAKNAAEIYADLHTNGVLSDEQNAAHARMQLDVDAARAAYEGCDPAVFPDMTQPESVQRSLQSGLLPTIAEA